MAGEPIGCWTCPLLSCSCLCPGFRELLNQAAKGEKKEVLMCDQCPIPVPLPPFRLSVEACGVICNLATLGGDGFNKVYKLAKQ